MTHRLAPPESGSARASPVQSPSSREAPLLSAAAAAALSHPPPPPPPAHAHASTSASTAPHSLSHSHSHAATHFHAHPSLTLPSMAHTATMGDTQQSSVVESPVVATTKPGMSIAFDATATQCHAPPARRHTAHGKHSSKRTHALNRGSSSKGGSNVLKPRAHMDANAHHSRASAVDPDALARSLVAGAPAPCTRARERSARRLASLEGLAPSFNGGGGGDPRSEFQADADAQPHEREADGRGGNSAKDAMMRDEVQRQRRKRTLATMLLSDPAASSTHGTASSSTESAPKRRRRTPRSPSLPPPVHSDSSSASASQPCRSSALAASPRRPSIRRSVSMTAPSSSSSHSSSSSSSRSVDDKPAAAVETKAVAQQCSGSPSLSCAASSGASSSAPKRRAVRRRSSFDGFDLSKRGSLSFSDDEDEDEEGDEEKLPAMMEEEEKSESRALVLSSSASLTSASASSLRFDLGDSLLGPPTPVPPPRAIELPPASASSLDSSASSAGCTPTTTSTLSSAMVPARLADAMNDDDDQDDGGNSNSDTEFDQSLALTVSHQNPLALSALHSHASSSSSSTALVPASSALVPHGGYPSSESLALVPASTALVPRGPAPTPVCSRRALSSATEGGAENATPALQRERCRGLQMHTTTPLAILSSSFSSEWSADTPSLSQSSTSSYASSSGQRFRPRSRTLSLGDMSATPKSSGERAKSQHHRHARRGTLPSPMSPPPPKPRFDGTSPTPLRRSLRLRRRSLGPRSAASDASASASYVHDDLDDQLLELTFLNSPSPGRRGGGGGGFRSPAAARRRSADANGRGATVPRSKKRSRRSSVKAHNIPSLSQKQRAATDAGTSGAGGVPPSRVGSSNNIIETSLRAADKGRQQQQHPPHKKRKKRTGSLTSDVQKEHPPTKRKHSAKDKQQRQSALKKPRTQSKHTDKSLERTQKRGQPTRRKTRAESAQASADGNSPMVDDAAAAGGKALVGVATRQPQVPPAMPPIFGVADSKLLTPEFARRLRQWRPFKFVDVLFRASNFGFLAEAFHHFCDAPRTRTTVVLVQIANPKRAAATAAAAGAAGTGTDASTATGTGTTATTAQPQQQQQSNAHASTTSSSSQQQQQPVAGAATAAAAAAPRNSHSSSRGGSGRTNAARGSQPNSSAHTAAQSDAWRDPVSRFYKKKEDDEYVVFGGLSVLPWCGSQVTDPSGSCFLFNLSDNKRFPLKQPSAHTADAPTCGLPPHCGHSHDSRHAMMQKPASGSSCPRHPPAHSQQRQNKPRESVAPPSLSGVAPVSKKGRANAQKPPLPLPRAVTPHRRYGPTFGRADLYIADRCNANESSGSLRCSYALPTPVALCGRRRFRVVEYEVLTIE